MAAKYTEMMEALTPAIVTGRWAVQKNAAKLLRDPTADQGLSGYLTPKHTAGTAEAHKSLSNLQLCLFRYTSSLSASWKCDGQGTLEKICLQIQSNKSVHKDKGIKHPNWLILFTFSSCYQILAVL